MQKQTQRSIFIAPILWLALSLGAVHAESPPTEPQYDLVVAGGRVIDPETGLDAVRHVGIQGGTITAISETPLEGQTS